MDNKNQKPLKLGFILSTSAQPFRCISHNPQEQIGCYNVIKSLYENREFWNFTFMLLHNTTKFIQNQLLKFDARCLRILFVRHAPPMSRMWVPMPMMWLRMRVSSANITRMYLARSGTSIFNNFSTASE
jgi:hypothetical protein